MGCIDIFVHIVRDKAKHQTILSRNASVRHGKKTSNRLITRDSFDLLVYPHLTETVQEMQWTMGGGGGGGGGGGCRRPCI